MSRRAFIGIALALLASACGSPPRDGDGVLAPPAAVKVSAVEPVPLSLVRAVGGYTNFRGARLVDWHPQRRGLLVAFQQAGRIQLHQVDAPGGPLRPLTRSGEPVRVGAYVPAKPNLVVYERDSGGDEAARLYRLDVETGVEAPLTDEGRRHALGPFNQAGTAFYASSVPLDRSRERSDLTTEILRIDPIAGTRSLVVALPGTGWSVSDASSDDKTLLIVRFKSVTDSELWSLERGGAAPTRLLPRAGEPPAFFGRALYAFDGSILVITDRDGEFRNLAQFDPRNGRIETLSGDVAWDVERLDRSTDRRTFVFVTNEGGIGVARVLDAETQRSSVIPAPTGASVVGAQPSPDGRNVALSFASSSTPSTVRVVDLATRVSTPWVSSDTAGIDTTRFGATDVIGWQSFDGLRISGLITRPDPKRFPGKRPVLIEIHGGPEGQARLGFLGRENYLINELGIAVIAPNVRGSTGFGKSFVALDDGRKREDAVRDIGALLDWIAAQPDLDASRVGVYGGSYGGYMVHAVAVHYSDRIRAAVAVVGISHFVSFLERTETYRRDLRRSEYGDERDPAMRAFLTRISPLENAARIKVPLFVIHGRNDPRVPVQEAEQIVRTVSASGVPTWSMIADNEGHGFAKKENADYAFYARVLFLRRYLLKEG